MKYIKLFFLLILILFITAGCTIRIKIRDADIRQLTDEEIEIANEHFKPLITDKEGRTYTSSISHFFTSFYDDPKDINISQFLRYFMPSDTVVDPDEFKALKKHEKWFFDKDVTIDKMPVPVHKITVEDLDEVLLKYADIRFSDLNLIGFDDPELIFLNEYNAFYNFTSDFAAGAFICTSGKINGNIVMLYSRKDVMLTLEKREDEYFVLSHQKINSP